MVVPKIDGEFLQTMDQEWAGTIRHIYGTTETMCSLYNPDPVGQHTRLRPGFYSHIRVIKVNGGVGDLIQPGQEGEIIVYADVDTMFSEYFNRPDATAEKLVDGWYYTGDIGLLHKNGDVDLIGRADDLIRSGGENIHPDEIEDLMASHPSVQEIAVIGTPHQNWGEAVTACIVAEDFSIESLDTFFRQSDMADFKRPRLYLLVECLPRNAANKILRGELKKMVEEARMGISSHELKGI